MSNPPTYSFCEDKKAQGQEVNMPDATFRAAYERRLNDQLNLFKDAEAAKSNNHELQYPRKDKQRKKLTLCIIGVVAMVISIVTVAVTVSVLSTKDARAPAVSPETSSANPQATTPIISTRAESTPGLIIVTHTVTVSAEQSTSTSSSSAVGTTTVTITPTQAPVTVTSSAPSIVSFVPSQAPVALNSNTGMVGTPSYSFAPTTIETSLSSSSSMNTDGIIIVPLTTITTNGVTTAIPIASAAASTSAQPAFSSTVQETPTRTYYKDLPAPKGTDHIKGGTLGFCSYPGSACMT